MIRPAENRAPPLRHGGCSVRCYLGRENASPSSMLKRRRSTGAVAQGRAPRLREMAMDRDQRCRPPAAAPTPSAQRGPNRSATQPTMGAPIGVPPSAMARKIAITRPRIAGSVESCTGCWPVGEGLRRHADDDEREAEEP